MKTVKLSEVAVVGIKPQIGDIAVQRTGKKFFIVSKEDIDNPKKFVSYVFIHPTKISVDEMMALLPGVLAFVPYEGKTIKSFSTKSLNDLQIPDLSTESAFNKTLMSNKAKIDESDAALKTAQTNYDKAVESSIAFVKAALADVNKEQ